MRGTRFKLYPLISPFLQLADIDPWKYFDTDTPHYSKNIESYARGLYSWIFVVCLAGAMISLAIVITSYTVAKASKKRAESLSGIIRVCKILLYIFGFVEFMNIIWFILHTVS